MERILTPEQMRTMYQETSQEGYTVFVDITHPRLPEKIYVCSDKYDFIYDERTYQGVQFQISLLSDNDEMPTASLTIANVDRRIGQALDDIDEPARIDIRVIALSEFDLGERPRTPRNASPVLIYQALYLFLIDVNVNVSQVTGKLVSWDYLQEPYPGMVASQSRCPGLFR